MEAVRVDRQSAFTDLPRRPPPQPRYFMLCHAFEPALKAYLAFHGATRKALTDKNLRHDLTELLTQAIKKGLSLSVTAPVDIKLLQEAHEKYWHRYAAPCARGAILLPVCPAGARESHGRPHVSKSGWL
jgi:hypothetical protein